MFFWPKTISAQYIHEWRQLNERALNGSHPVFALPLVSVAAVVTLQPSYTRRGNTFPSFNTSLLDKLVLA